MSRVHERYRRTCNSKDLYVTLRSHVRVETEMQNKDISPQQAWLVVDVSSEVRIISSLFVVRRSTSDTWLRVPLKRNDTGVRGRAGVLSVVDWRLARTTDQHHHVQLHRAGRQRARQRVSAGPRPRLVSTTWVVHCRQRVQRHGVSARHKSVVFFGWRCARSHIFTSGERL